MRNGRRILTAILACVLTLMLAACTSGSGSGKTNGDAPDPDKIRGEEVTEKVWKDAFDFKGITNVTVRGMSEGSYEEDEDSQTGDTIRYVELCRYDGDKMYESVDMAVFSAKGKRKETLESYEAYVAEENGKIYEYSHPKEDDGEDTSRWEKNEDESVEFRPINRHINNHFGEVLPDFRDNYRAYRYDEGKKAYTSTYYDPETEDSCPAIVKIADKKLQVIQLLWDDSEEEGTVTIQFYDYGTTKVTLPKIKDEGGAGTTTPEPTVGERVTEQEWRDAMHQNEIGNFTEEITGTETLVDGSAIKATSYIKWTKDKAYQKITQEVDGEKTESETYWSRENNKTYRFTCDAAKKWRKQEIDSEWEFGYFVLVTPLDDYSSAYDAFTYDTKQKAYVGVLEDGEQNLTITFLNKKVHKIHLIYSSRYGEGESVFRFSDYGTTTVTLPKVA